MSIAQETVDDVQLAEEVLLKGEEVAGRLIDLALEYVGKDKAAALLDAAAVKRANAIADAVALAKFGPEKTP